NTTLLVQMGAKALLCCPAIPETKAVLIIWVIAPRGQPPCRISYRVDTKEIKETNCTDRRITWTFTPDQSPELQINAVALDHDGLYSCEMLTLQGNFLRRHDLQVLVPPTVSLLPGENRTAVCEAIAGKPAAQIFWTPDGDHVTKKESHSNGTVTVRSTYHWEQNNVSAVFCFVSHPTGNLTLSIELNQGQCPPSVLKNKYLIFNLFFRERKVFYFHSVCDNCCGQIHLEEERGKSRQLK
ncbi:hypothetical protein U0070_000171, partial [Myodes glareolus]